MSSRALSQAPGGGVQKGYKKKQKPINPLSRPQQQKEKAKKTFGKHLVDVKLPDIVKFNEYEVALGNLNSVDDTLTAAVIWECYQQGFRFELFALDRYVMPLLWSTPASAAHRDSLIRRVFSEEASWVFNDLPPKNIGLAADTWEERRTYTDYFCVVISKWPMAPASLKAGYVTEAQREAEAAKFYVKTFWNAFERPPLIPHRIPTGYRSSRSQD